MILYKSFANYSQANIKLSKIQRSKTQSGGLLGKLLGQLTKVELPITKNALLHYLKM